MLDFDLSNDLKDKISKLAKKDKPKLLKINKKIKEIIDNDSDSINRYKNLKHDLKEFKRVHIDKSFVLTFKVEKDKVIFMDFDHHDNIY